MSSTKSPRQFSGSRAPTFSGSRRPTSIRRDGWKRWSGARQTAASPGNRFAQSSNRATYRGRGGTKTSARRAQTACLGVVTRLVDHQTVDRRVSRRPCERLPDHALLRRLALVERKRSHREDPVRLGGRCRFHPPVGRLLERLGKIRETLLGRKERE